MNRLIFYLPTPLAGSVLFFITMFWMEGRPSPVEETTTTSAPTEAVENGKRNGHDNIVFTTTDEMQMPRLDRSSGRSYSVENSKL